MVQKTLNFGNTLINKRLIDFFSWSITTPFPGSELFHIARRHKILKENFTDERKEWIKDYNAMMELPGVTDRDLLRLKIKGSFLTAKCLLKSGNIGLKDAKYFWQRAAKLGLNYCKLKKI